MPVVSAARIARNCRAFGPVMIAVPFAETVTVKFATVVSVVPSMTSVEVIVAGYCPAGTVPGGRLSVTAIHVRFPV